MFVILHISKLILTKKVPRGQSAQIVKKGHKWYVYKGLRYKIKVLAAPYTEISVLCEKGFIFH